MSEVEMVKEENQEKKPSLLREVLSFVFYILSLLIVAWLLVHFVGQRTGVIGQSMESTLYNNDQIIVDKLSYRFHEPERFDVVVFPYQYADQTYYVKRIIGMPGERVYIDVEGRIYINGEVLHEDYGREAIEPSKRLLATAEIQLGNDEYFVLGDNRNASSDSREPSVGNVKRDIILGRAWVRIYPFGEMGVIRHQ